MNIRRLGGGPIVFPEMDETLGENINGPSLIRVPDWVKNPLGRYYLYFGHHQGRFIRLAYSDLVEGPWRIFREGALKLSQTPCTDHIASPDARVDDENRRIVMYYHGVALKPREAKRDRLTKQFPFLGGQRTLAAASSDGMNFTSFPQIIGPGYCRFFFWSGYHYALCMPGLFFRSLDGLKDFEQGPTLFNKHMRHAAVKVVGRTLFVFFSIVGDYPEHIVLSKIDLGSDWSDWRESPPVSILKPEEDYEGAGLKLEKSVRGEATDKVRQLRDPFVFEDGGHFYLIYCVAGESGIAVAEISDLF